MAHTATQGTAATGPARAAVAIGRPRAGRWPEGMFTSALPRTGAPFGEAQ